MRVVHHLVPGSGAGVLSPWGSVLLQLHLFLLRSSTVVECSCRSHADGLLLMPKHRTQQRTGASAPVPSAGLSSRHPTTPVASECRFQASPGAKFTQPQGEEKDCEARPPLPLSFGGRGSAIFSISSALSAQDLGPE